MEICRSEFLAKSRLVNKLPYLKNRFTEKRKRLFGLRLLVTGMTSFMNVKFNGALNDQVNFKTFGHSMMVLFRLVTSAGWNDVLDPLMNTENCTMTTENQPGDCGEPLIAVLYFVFFIFIVFLGMLPSH